MTACFGAQSPNCDSLPQSWSLSTICGWKEIKFFKAHHENKFHNHYPAVKHTLTTHSQLPWNHSFWMCAMCFVLFFNDVIEHCNLISGPLSFHSFCPRLSHFSNREVLCKRISYFSIDKFTQLIILSNKLKEDGFATNSHVRILDMNINS